MPRRRMKNMAKLKIPHVVIALIITTIIFFSIFLPIKNSEACTDEICLLPGIAERIQETKN